jgi:AhpD family alkylhydroperoxidase
MISQTHQQPVRVDFDNVASTFSEAMAELDRAATRELNRVGFDRGLGELIRLRVSQINGCVYCVGMHSKDARAAGESERRLTELAVWRESPSFTTRERAALAFAELVTLVADSGVPDQAYAEIAEHYTGDEIAALISLIVTMNAWNRIGVSTRAWTTEG